MAGNAILFRIEREEKVMGYYPSSVLGIPWAMPPFLLLTVTPVRLTLCHFLAVWHRLGKTTLALSLSFCRMKSSDEMFLVILSGSSLLQRVVWPCSECLYLPTFC